MSRTDNVDRVDAMRTFKWTSDHLTLLLDHREKELQQVLQLPDSKLPFEMLVGELTVADALVCAKLTEQELMQVYAEQRSVQKKQSAAKKRKSPSSALNSDTNKLQGNHMGPIVHSKVNQEQSEDYLDSESIDTDTIEDQAYDLLESIDEDYDEDAATDKKSERTADEMGTFVYNPVVEQFNQGASIQPRIDRTKIYVPLVAIERKHAEDLGQSITGKSKNQPGFVRYKEQKLRMKSFQRMTGCTLMIVVEEHHTRFANAKFIGGLPENAFRSALVHTMLRDKIYVDASQNFFDTARLLEKIGTEVLDKQFRNFIFPHLFMSIRRAVATNTLGAPVPSSSDREEHQRQQMAFDECIQQLCMREALTRERIFDGVFATEKLLSAHSQIINIHKKDNKDPTLCYQMMLQCVHGVSDKMAKAVVQHYPTMPALIDAYAKCKDDKRRALLLKDLETDTFTPKGKRRKVGPAKSKQIYDTLFSTESIGSTTSTSVGKK